MPSERVRELEKLLAKIRNAGTISLNFDMWERWGEQHATPEQAEAMRAEFARATSDREAATAALEALVAKTRAEAPAEIAAWADAHDQYLAAFLEECKPDDTGAFVAKRERAEWAEVRSGTRTFVDENVFYVTDNPHRYRRLFGFDPRALDAKLTIGLADRAAGLEVSATSLRWTGRPDVEAPLVASERRTDPDDGTPLVASERRTDPDDGASERATNRGEGPPLIAWELATKIPVDDPVAIAGLAAQYPMPAAMLADLARRCIAAPTAVAVAHGTGFDTRWARALAAALLEAGKCTPRVFSSEAPVVLDEIVWGLRVMPDGSLVGLDSNLRRLITSERKIDVPQGGLDAYEWLALFDGTGFPAIEVPRRATNGRPMAVSNRWLLTFTDENAPAKSDIWRAHELAWTHLDRKEQVRHAWDHHVSRLVEANGVVWCPAEDGLWRLVGGEAPVRVWNGNAYGVAIADGVAWVSTRDNALVSIDIARGVETARVSLPHSAFDVRVVPGGIIAGGSRCVSWIVGREVIATSEERREVAIAVLADGTAAASSGEQVAILDPSGTLRWCPPMPFDGCIRCATRDRFVFGAFTSGEDYVSPTELIAFDRDGRVTARLPNQYRLPVVAGADYVYATLDRGVVRWDPRGSAKDTELVAPPPRRPTERGVTQIRSPVTNPRDERPEVGIEIRHANALVLDGTYGGSCGTHYGSEAAVRVSDGAIATFVRCDLTRGDGVAVQRGATVFAIQCKLSSWGVARGSHLVAIDCTVGDETGKTLIASGAAAIAS